MKRILSALLFLACSAANAQFVTGQILTAAQLNAAFANVLSTSGGTLTGPLTVQGSTTLTNLTVNGTFTVPGGFSPSSLSPQAANTILANVTGASASPAAASIPSCSTVNSAIKYTSGAGWGCGTVFALTSGTLAQFAATTSAQLAGIVSDESGSGSLLFGTSPTITTPAITGGTISGAPISGSTGSFTTLGASANDALLYSNTSAQSIATGTASTVTGWTKVFDRDNANFNASTGTFTAPATGFYWVSAQVTYASASSVISTYNTTIVANGVSVASGAFSVEVAGVNLPISLPVSALVSLSVGQTVVIQTLQGTGASKSLSASASLTYVSIVRVP